MTETRSFTASDGAVLRYTDAGGPGRPVVLVAGYAMPATGWALQTDTLEEAGYRVIAFDRRSHGASDDVHWGQRVSRHGADIAELLDAAGIGDDAVLVGQSMGASASWAYLDLFGTGRIAGLVTIDQTPAMINRDDWPHGFYGLTPENSGVFFRDGIPDTGRPGPSIDPARSGIMRLIERLGGPPAVRQPNAPETMRLLQDHAVQDWRDVIARLDIPFLMVAGRDSQLWPCEHAAASVGENPSGSVVVIENAGHATNLDAPEEFNAALLDFLAALG